MQAIPTGVREGSTVAEKVFSPSRKAQRFAPDQPVTVAILDQGVPMAYGVVLDISESGTCVQTNVVPKRQSFDVTLSFYNGEYVRATGRVVWSEPKGALASVGIEFTALPDSVSREPKSRAQVDRFRYDLSLER